MKEKQPTQHFLSVINSMMLETQLSSLRYLNLPTFQFTMRNRQRNLKTSPLWVAHGIPSEEIHLGSQIIIRTQISDYRIRGEDVSSEVECLMTLAVIPALGKSIGGRHMLWMDTALKVSLVRMHSVAYYATFLRTFSVLKYVFII